MENCYQHAEHYFRVMRAANASARKGRGEAMPEPEAIDYKTHILIGVRANGVMTVIADWPHVPQAGRGAEGDRRGPQRLY